MKKPVGRQRRIFHNFYYFVSHIILKPTCSYERERMERRMGQRKEREEEGIKRQKR